MLRRYSIIVVVGVVVNVLMSCCEEYTTSLENVR